MYTTSAAHIARVLCQSRASTAAVQSSSVILRMLSRSSTVRVDTALVMVTSTLPRLKRRKLAPSPVGDCDQQSTIANQQSPTNHQSQIRNQQSSYFHATRNG